MVAAALGAAALAASRPAADLPAAVLASSSSGRKFWWQACSFGGSSFGSCSSTLLLNPISFDSSKTLCFLLSSSSGGFLLGSGFGFSFGVRFWSWLINATRCTTFTGLFSCFGLRYDALIMIKTAIVASGATALITHVVTDLSLIHI